MKKLMNQTSHIELQKKCDDLYIVMRKHKEDLGLTNQDVSEAIESPQDRVRKYFAGELKNPSVYGVMSLCMLFGLSLDALLGNTHGQTEKADAAELARLEKENAILSIKLENEQRFLQRVEKILRRTTIGVFVLLGMCVVLVLTLSSYFRMDIANKNIGFVRDAYVAPMAVVVFAVLLAAVAIIIALIVGLFKENRKKGEDKNGN